MSKKRNLSILAVVSGLAVWALTTLGNGKIFNTSSELCLSQFYEQSPPELTNPKLKASNYPLCYEGFALNYSGISKTSLWVAEKLTRERLATKIQRNNNFHEEERLPVQVRALLTDYRGSGYDRGHMAPSGDMATETSQFDSFSLANMIPQNSDNNQNTWRNIEESTRSMVKKYQLDAYVVTGPAYLNKTVKYIQKGHSVLVPSHVYKAVYFPKVGMASVYLSKNDDSRQVQMISVCELEEKVGINIFPAADENVKRQVYAFATQPTQIKANQKPTLLKTDLQSQCAPKPTASETKATQQQFVTGKSYSSTVSDRATTANERTSSITSTPNNQNQSLNIEQLIVPAIEWLKQK